MKFLLCFCFKRNRTTSNISSKTISYTPSNSVLPLVTSAPFSVSSDLPDKSNEKEINEYLAATTSMECGGYAKIRKTQSLQPLFDDDTELYATIDKTRKAKNAIRIKIDDTNTIDAHLPQRSLSASTTTSSLQPISSSRLHLSEFAIVSEHPPPVYMNIAENTIINNHDDTANHHRSCSDDVKRREPLQYRDRRLKTEDEHQFRENYHLYVNISRNSDDTYAELGNDSATDTVYQNIELHSSSRPSNSSEIDDDLSERYATIIDINNTEEQSITNDIFQGIQSMMF